MASQRPLPSPNSVLKSGGLAKPDHAPSALQTLPRPLALVISGNASLGALQVGQLRAVVKAGMIPDRIVGTSVGAINGLFMARAFTAARVDTLADVWKFDRLSRRVDWSRDSDKCAARLGLYRHPSSVVGRDNGPNVFGQSV